MSRCGAQQARGSCRVRVEVWQEDAEAHLGKKEVKQCPTSLSNPIHETGINSSQNPIPNDGRLCQSHGWDWECVEPFLILLRKYNRRLACSPESYNHFNGLREETNNSSGAWGTERICIAYQGRDGAIIDFDLQTKEQLRKTSGLL